MRAIASLVVVSALAGCLEPSTKACGTLACPEDTACVALETNGPTCLPIASCDRAATGTACDPGNGQEGTCVGGGCRPIERCGNGIVDSGESCDCGDEQVAPRTDCNARNNSDIDPLSPCRGDCVLRTCGDDQLDATEQCEGDAIADGLSCETFGYYNGTLACSPLCLVDRSACTGRCGDGTLDPDHEYCDPLAPGVVGYCTEFAYSTGTLRCGGTCGPDFRGCTDGIVFTDLLPGRNDLLDIVAGPTPTSAWVAARIQAWLYDEDTGLRDLHVPTTSALLDLASSGTRVAISALGGQVFLYDATGTLIETLAAPFDCEQIAMTTETTFACLGDLSTVWWTAGVWATPIASATAIEALARSDGSIIYSAWGGGPDQKDSVHRVTQTADAAMSGSLTVAYFDETTTGIGATPAGIYGGLGYGGATYGMMKLVGDASWTPAGGTAGYYGVSNIGGRTIWKPRDRTAGVIAQVPNRATGSLDGAETPCLRFLTTGSTALCLSANFDRSEGARLYRYAGASASQVATTGLAADTLSDAFVDGNDRLYFIGKANNTGGTLPSSSWRPPTPGVGVATFDQIADVRGSNVVITGRPSGSTIANAYGFWNGSSWGQGVTTAPILAAAVASSTELVVVIGFGAQENCSILRGAPNALVEIDVSACARALWVSPAGTIWAVANGSVRDVTNHHTYPLSTPAPTTVAISGLDDTHVYVATGSDIWFYDGVTWTLQLRTPDNVQFDWVNATARGTIASSRTPLRTAWFQFTKSGAPVWNKMRLPTDPTVLIEPMLRPWGVVFRASDNTLRYSVWQDTWPE